MQASKIDTNSINLRTVPRINAHIFLKLTETMKGNSSTVLTTDISDSGIGVLTSCPLPVGSKVLVSFCGREIATATVAALTKDCDGDLGISHMGLVIAEKSRYWQLD